MDNLNRSKSWFKQAQNDLAWGKDSCKSGHYAQTCFISQQVSEKALKALAYHRNFDLVKSHSLAKIAKELGINGEIEKIAKKLDLYYIATRYPDSLPDMGVPSDYFDKDQADEALGFAEIILNKVKEEISLK